MRNAWLYRLSDDPVPGIPAYCDLDDAGRRELFQWSQQSDEIGFLMAAASRLQTIRKSLLTTSALGAWGIAPAVLADLIARAGPEALMGAESLAGFNRLPGTVTVYRGSAGVPVETARLGMSWATVKSAAKEFAWCNAALGPPVVVLTGRVRKAEVLAGLRLDMRRVECVSGDPLIELPELICRSGAVHLTKIKTWRPGELLAFAA